MFKSYNEVKYGPVNENLTTLATMLSNKKGYEIEIKNEDALNSTDNLNSLTVKVKKGNIQKLVDFVTNIYSYEADVELKNNTVVFKML